MTPIPESRSLLRRWTAPLQGWRGRLLGFAVLTAVGSALGLMAVTSAGAPVDPVGDDERGLGHRQVALDVARQFLGHGDVPIDLREAGPLDVGHPARLRVPAMVGEDEARRTEQEPRHRGGENRPAVSMDDVGPEPGQFAEQRAREPGNPETAPAAAVPHRDPARLELLEVEAELRGREDRGLEAPLEELEGQVPHRAFEATPGETVDHHRDADARSGCGGVRRPGGRGRRSGRCHRRPGQERTASRKRRRHRAYRVGPRVSRR